MISKPLFKRNMISAMKLMIIFISVLAMYTIVIIWMYKPELFNFLEQYKEMMPGIMAAVGMNGSSGTLIEFINSYLYGFIMLIVPMIFEIILASRMVMKYVDTGSLSNLLSTPNSRKKIIITQMTSIIVSIFVLISVVTIIGIVSSELMFRGKLDIEKYIILNFSVFILHLAISGIAVFAACLFNDNKGFIAFGSGIPLVFYLIHMLSNMGGKLNWLKYLTLYTLFRGEGIVLNGGGVFCSNIIMIIIATILYISAIVIFIKKDLQL